MWWNLLIHMLNEHTFGYTCLAKKKQRNATSGVWETARHATRGAGALGRVAWAAGTCLLPSLLALRASANGSLPLTLPLSHTLESDLVSLNTASCLVLRLKNSTCSVAGARLAVSDFLMDRTWPQQGSLQRCCPVSSALLGFVFCTDF